MTTNLMANLIFAAGFAQLGVLIAATQVPSRLKWHTELRSLPPLHRQMHWVYAGFITLSIVAFSVLSVFNAQELAHGSPLARVICGYIAVWWTVRLALQAVFDIKPYLTASWMRAGYHMLTVVFAGLATVFAMASLL
jgi:hypothetical protein